MTLPASGAISFSNINVELCRSSTAQLSLNDSCLRTLFGQASGAVCMNTGHGKTNTSVPGAPTGVSASATSSSAISVSFSAPGCTGHLAIDYYQAVCTSSGSNSATGASSPISVTGLSASTSYTFKVRAHNSKGYGCYSSSTGTATTQAPTGSVSFTTPGQYTWTVPCGVTSISAFAISGGKGGGFSSSPIHFGPAYDCYGRETYNFDWYVTGGGGYGGQAAWRNNISVTPGQTLYLSVGDVSQQLNNCWVPQTTYLSKARNTSNFTNYYNSAWRCSVVWLQDYDWYTLNYCSSNPQGQSVGITTNLDSSYKSQGGSRASTVRGNAFGTYYGGSGVCGSKTTGGGGGGGPPALSSGHSGCAPGAYNTGAGSSGHGGTACTTCASGIPGIRGPIDYGSSSGQAGTSGGGAGGNAGYAGYGSGALFGSSASQGSQGGYGAGGAGANYTGSRTLSSCRGGQGALRIVWPGSTRGWPNTGVCYGS